MKRSLRLTTVAIIAGLMSMHVGHAAIVEVVIVGRVHLDLETGDGIDDENVDGANFVARYQYDSTAVAIQNPASSDSAASTYYRSLMAEQQWTNRPNGAPDLVFAYQPIIVVTNWFLPGRSRYDTVRFYGAGPFTYGPGPSIFFSWDYFPGTSPAPLPIPVPEDLLHFTTWETFSDYYLDYESSVSVVPIPAVGWLLGPALGILGLMRRR